MPRGGRIIEKDRGWKRIQTQLRSMGAVKVGLPSDSPADEETGVSLVFIGWWNEYGTDDGHVPERPFMRQAFDDNLALIRQAQDRLVSGIYAGQYSTDRALRLLGELHQAHIQKSITELRQPPNAPSTVARKGSSNPLIDSEQMRDNIRYEVER